MRDLQALAQRAVSRPAVRIAAVDAGDPAHFDDCADEINGCLLQLLEATPGLVMAATLQGKLLYLNSKGRSLLGFRPDALRRLRLEDIFSAPSYRRVRNEAIPGCLRIGHWQGELALIDAARREIPVAQVLTAHELTESHQRAKILCGIAWDMREHKRTEIHLRYRATHDELTGLPNRALLIDRLTQALRTAERQRQRLGVFFLDLDSFKQVNDDFGHEAGNGLLRQVAVRLCQRVRASDTVARYGGDEFVLLQPGLTRAEDAQRGLQLLREVLREPFSIAGRRVRIGASVGVALFPDDGEDAETLLRKSDTEMYAVKKKAARPSMNTIAPLRNVDRAATTEQTPSRC